MNGIRILVATMAVLACGIGAAPAQQEEKPTVRVYTVRVGDTLTKIAGRTLGSMRHWQKLVEANPDLDFRTIKPGQRIVLPTAARTQDDELANALEKVQAHVRAATRAEKPEAVEAALIEAEKAIMEARRALLKTKKPKGKGQ